MAQNDSYRDIVIYTYPNAGEASGALVRARPFLGQGLDSCLRVERSKQMRNSYPIGTCFMVHARVTDREGTLFGYTHYNWGFEVLTRTEAEDSVRSNSLGTARL